MRPVAGSIALGVVVGLAAPAHGASTHRFEPTDLEMEDPGTMELDLQVGVSHGDGVWRTTIPDFEFDLGLAPGVELDIDGTNNVEGGADGRFSFDHVAPDNLWFCSKLGLLDVRDERADTAWAFGIQLGPKLPLAHDARGVGYEALALVGRRIEKTQLALNLGGVVDPGDQVSSGRPVGVEAGLDVNYGVGRSPFSILGELGGIHYVSSNHDLLSGTLGIAWQASDAVEFSLMGLVGLLPNDNHSAILLGFSPKLSAWK